MHVNQQAVLAELDNFELYEDYSLYEEPLVNTHALFATILQIINLLSSFASYYYRINFLSFIAHHTDKQIN